ncbi:MAG: polysaccharide deacetylase family protein, partial [Campylobacterota bacterium]
VDIPLKYNNFTSGFKEILGDILKRKNIPLSMRNLAKKTNVLLSLETDPFDTFDFLMDISEKLGTKSHFFFMGKGVTKFDNLYKSDDPFIKKLIATIKDRAHHIGIHPTYNAYNDQLQFKKEKEELEKNLDTDILIGREHYLRFEVPATWQVWEDNGMLWDSTLGFADKEGFRCGTCYPYSVFNILSREKLQLKERPLIVMEGNFSTYQHHIKAKEMEDKIKALIHKIKKYDGEFVFLWHNSSFNTSQWEEYQSVYEKVLT